MEEVYTIKEVAAMLGVPWQKVAALKRKGQIPSTGMTPEGTFIKTIIDPMIEIYKNAPPSALPPEKKASEKPLPKKQLSQAMPKKTKGYSKKVRQEAHRLFEQNTPLTQVAKQIGCSVECARQWRKKYQESTTTTPPEASVPSSPASVPTEVKAESVSSTKKKSPIGFDEFVRGYWQEESRAVDVMLLPPEIGPKVSQYVNEALKYAYKKLR